MTGARPPQRALRAARQAAVLALLAVVPPADAATPPTHAPTAAAAGRPGAAPACAAPDSVREAVVALLTAQQAAWNRGDLEGFMRGYADSPDLVFTSGGRVQRGYRTVLERYRATYGTGAEMGRLAFSGVEVHALGADAAWALGRWELERGGRRLGGLFTLVLERREGAWRIVHDHTSSDPEPEDDSP